AELGDGPQSTAEVTERAGYKRRTSSGKARQALIRKGLIYDPELGTVDFTVPHFADFMRRRYPLARLLKPADEAESGSDRAQAVLWTDVGISPDNPTSDSPTASSNRANRAQRPRKQIWGFRHKTPHPDGRSWQPAWHPDWVELPAPLPAPRA